MKIFSCTARSNAFIIHSFTNTIYSITLTIILPIRDIGDATQGANLNDMQPEDQRSQEPGQTLGRPTTAQRQLLVQLRYVVIAIAAGDQETRTDVQSDGDAPEVALRTDSGDGADRRDDVENLTRTIKGVFRFG